LRFRLWRYSRSPELLALRLGPPKAGTVSPAGDAYRLFEQMRLVKQVREASAVDLSMDWLMPYMTKRRVEAGQISVLQRPSRRRDVNTHHPRGL
jgi:hypothetical protein